MTTSTLTLADFLLARIAEDEAMARDARCWTGNHPSPLRIVEKVLAIDSRRVLAECEAKRRIVARFGWAEDIRGTDEHDTLADLATPYSDHPDYRTEWTP